MRKNMRERAGRHAGVNVVAAAREDYRHSRAEHDSRRIGARQKNQLLRQNIAGLEIGRDEYVGVAPNGRDDVFRGRRLRRNGGVEGQRPIEVRARYLAAIGHLAQGRRLDRRGDFCLHRLHGRENCNLGPRNADGVRKIDSVSNNVALVIEARAIC